MLGRPLARGVGVIGQDDAARKAGEQLDVPLRQRRAASGHRLGDAGAVQADHIGVTLAHHHPALLDDG